MSHPDRFEMLMESGAPTLAEAVEALRPTLHRIRRGEIGVLVTGATPARDRDEAALLTARLMELYDASDELRRLSR